jgi:hypothetical protein
MPLVLAGMVTLVLLSGQVVVGQGTLDAGATAVIGSIEWAAHNDTPVITLRGGMQRSDGVSWSWRAKADDPRVSGTFRMLGATSLEFIGPMTVSSGPVALENADGRWVGSWSGGLQHDMGWQGIGFLTGEGDYEGHTYLMHAENAQYSIDELQTHGIIYPGDPPIPPSDEPPAQ